MLTLIISLVRSSCGKGQSLARAHWNNEVKFLLVVSSLYSFVLSGFRTHEAEAIQT